MNRADLPPPPIPCSLYETEDAEIDLNRSRSDALIIHSSTPSAQQQVGDIIQRIGPEQFDRLAFPRVSEGIRSNPVVQEWIGVLKSKHHFGEIHIAEPENKNQKAARALLKRTFPDLSINFHRLDIDPDAKAEGLVIHCADPRFQEQFDAIIAESRLQSYERLSVAGASLAFRSREVLRWLKATVGDNMPETVHLMDHTDCAIAGGLSHYGYDEHGEALVHARSLHETAAMIKSIVPSQPPRVIQHIVGIQGRLKVSELQRELSLEEQ